MKAREGCKFSIQTILEKIRKLYKSFELGLLNPCTWEPGILVVILYLIAGAGRFFARDGEAMGSCEVFPSTIHKTRT